MQFTQLAKFTALSLLVAAVRGAPQPEDAKRDLEARQSYSDVRMTYFYTGNPGTGACGGQEYDTQYIVALDSDLYDGGANCYKTITIEYNGQSTQASILDECPGCPYGGLDLTPSLFEYFAPLSQGVIYGDWYYD
ncbi:uncharacterized protein LAESUDRAFT_764705 [Laetiporus sulphureus 93-53]|uniref:Plant expansin n=1 Tax=Laetiporus sulphureus 93-53 TaxID=1314785 RepID=A0A165B6G8_9APHY|nr:uncharacterized protein LAESUDRAFT_764705 [Laetiporus sulphureus 93-53]KZT00351.1 hypothetical protein LAESUDRAFT_764705 [Laetiporus sulphureus 93-53]